MPISINRSRILAAFLGSALWACGTEHSNAAAPAGVDPRIAWGRQQIEAALRRTGQSSEGGSAVGVDVRAGIPGAELPARARRPEGYRVRFGSRSIRVDGLDPAGAMYGCLEAARRIAASGRLPGETDIADAPALGLRGTCILLMKLGTYNYPITPEEFPFFYDRQLWLEYLDFLAAQRLNFISLWNGHPFAYFARLEKYPEAQAGMAPELLEQNREMLAWLAREAERRNIWLLFQFYNIHTSVYFQKAHGLPEEISRPTPLLADYTGHAIERFVSEFPGIGLYVCPGEALELEHTDRWINDVIFPAVKRTGKTPPVVVRSWGIDLEHMRKVAGNYPRLYTERKYNVEMLASTEIDPENAEWARITGDHIVNIHLVANLEPFRWNPPGYIQRCIQSSVRAGATGVQIYPRKAWRWPYGSDAGPLELQWKRDALYFEAWARYAWNPALDSAQERAHWLRRLADRFGTSKAAQHLLDSFEAGADVLPALQRLLWIGDSNHTIIAAGAKLSQIEKAPGIPFLALPEMPRIPRFIEELRAGRKPEVVDPAAFVAAKAAEARRALRAAEAGARAAKRNQQEASRIESDARAVALVARFYEEKIRAAISGSLFAAGIERDANAAGLRKHLKASLDIFRSLVALTARTYTSISDVPAWHPVRLQACPYHWSDLLPVYEAEARRIKEDMRFALVPSDAPFRKPTLPGLAGILYGNPNWDRPERPFPAASLEFDWTVRGPEDGKNWSAEWFGTLVAPASGTVRFLVESDRGASLSLDGHALVEWRGEPGTREGMLQMEAGKAYALRLAYNHDGGAGGRLRVLWSWAGRPPVLISGNCLLHSPADKRRMENAAEDPGSR
ncbi:MAG: hypothetical protein HXY20_07725 [Acidobacteria bacterium]|nr:hypothetical protein [Acidobacteriota bacterium]